MILAQMGPTPHLEEHCNLRPSLEAWDGDGESPL